LPEYDTDEPAYPVYTKWEDAGMLLAVLFTGLLLTILLTIPVIGAMYLIEEFPKLFE
jgi:hypothetical protein